MGWDGRFELDNWMGEGALASCYPTDFMQIQNTECIGSIRWDDEVRLWESESENCIGVGIGHMGAVGAVAFSKRKRDFFVWSMDGLSDNMTPPNDSLVCSGSQVWALAVGRKREILATGGGDAVVNLWFDSTAADKEEAFHKEEEEGVLKGQELENAVSNADYTQAIQIAFELRRPHRLFELFAELCRKREAEDHIDRALKGLGDEELLFGIFPPTDSFQIKGIGELLEGIIPYSQRHFGRIDRLVRSTFLLDYILSGMSVIEQEVQPTESSTELLLQSNIDVPDTENVIEEKDHTAEITASKKRKSNKSRHGSHKKVKNVAFNKVESIQLQA
ncbi:unnamed protein product [Sphenostylis stenocarpa]|uniref:U3 small nucleolar RNA-associated protein 13 C-terminal domain-containing protein n=1 Tax=Sphenostylis stenocarpa TaxID=92480 RepID=A0AA86S6C7_9FABA|nr:unnamed protein product [Sphenostylis stenocarpa]